MHAGCCWPAGPGSSQHGGMGLCGRVRKREVPRASSHPLLLSQHALPSPLSTPTLQTRCLPQLPTTWWLASSSTCPAAVMCGSACAGSLLRQLRCCPSGAEQGLSSLAVQLSGTIPDNWCSDTWQLLGQHCSQLPCPCLYCLQVACARCKRDR